MRWSILAVPLLVCGASLAWGDAPTATIAPVASALPGELVEIDASGSTGDAFDWECLSGKSFKPSESGKRAYFATLTPGKYEFLFIAIGVQDGKASIAKARVIVVIDGPAPPAPDPTPDPTPTPTPVVSGHIYATYIADASDLLPSHAAMKRPADLLKAFGPLDASWRWYQSDQSEPTKLNLLGANPKFPMVVIQGPDGKLLKPPLVGPSVSDILDVIKSLRGTK